MKKIATILVVLILSVVCVFADNTGNMYEYDEIFDVAKKENKSVLMYFYSNTCGEICRVENSILQNDTVMDYINKYYILYSVNLDTDEGKKVNKKYKIKDITTYLFLDSDGVMFHQIVRFFNTDEVEKLLSVLEKSLDKTSGLGYFKNKYKSGNREKEFLYEYCYKLHNARQLDANIITEYLNSLSQDELSNKKNLKFLYDFIYYNKKSMVSEDSFIFDFIEDNWHRFSVISNEEQAKVRYIALLIYYAYKAQSNKDYNSLVKWIKKLEKFESNIPYSFINRKGVVENIFLNGYVKEWHLLEYYREHDINTYYKYRDSIIRNCWDNPRKLRYFAYFSQLAPRKSDELPEFKKWIERSIEIEEKYYNTLTYLDILYKLEEYDKALKVAEKSIELAKEEGVKDHSYAENLIRSIERKLNQQNK